MYMLHGNFLELRLAQNHTGADRRNNDKTMIARSRLH
jgi:hypothetical protein